MSLTRSDASYNRPDEPNGVSPRLLLPGVLRPFALVTGLFLLWGIPNSMNDVLVRQFMKAFTISRFQAGLVQSAFYLGYFLLALPAGLIMRRFGYKSGFITGLLLFALGCLLFLPAANSGHYSFFLTALFILASGLAFLETASNPFVVQLGPPATSEFRLNLAQAFNPVGCIVGVLIGTVFIFSGVEWTPAQVHSMQAAGTYASYLHREILRVVTPYVIIGIVALFWAVLIGTTRFPASLRHREAEAEASGDWRLLLRQPHFLLAVVAQFTYCGSQVGSWSYLIQYAKDYALTTEKFAGGLLALNMVIFGVGRFASAVLMRRFSPASMMRLYGLVNAFLFLMAVFIPGWPGLVALLTTSFFLSLMFPTIFALGLKRLGANTNLAGSLIVMAIVGGAVVAPFMGGIAELLHSTARSYQVPLYGSLLIAAYAHYMMRYGPAD